MKCLFGLRWPALISVAVFTPLSGCGEAAVETGPAAGVDRVSAFGQYRGYSVASYDGFERTSVHVAMRDDVRIAVDFLRPTAGGRLHEEPLPVIWTHTRYQRANLSEGRLNTVTDLLPFTAHMLRHGYVVAIADVRGSGASYGTKYGWFPPEEAQDAYDITEWLADQRWSDGNVGMYGLSYLGITQYFAASESPPHLRAIFPKVAWFDAYNFAYPGGIFTDWVVESWGRGVESVDTSASLPADWRRMVAEGEARQAASGHLAECRRAPCAPMGGPIVPVDADTSAALLRAATEEHRASPNIHDIVAKLPFRDSRPAGGITAFHEERSLYGRLDRIGASGVPAYHVGGWYDGFPRETALWYRNYPGPQKMMIGPWYHSDITELDITEHHRWFDHWLKGVENGVMEEDPVHYWTLGAPRGEEWSSATEWPLPEEERVDYFFYRGPTASVASINDGLLATSGHYSDSGTGIHEYTVDYSTSVGLDNRWTLTAGGAAGGVPYENLRENDEKALTYTSEVLTSDLEVTGHPVVHLWVTATVPTVDFFVYLEEVLPDGTPVMITEGMLRASHRRTEEPPYDNLGLPWHPHGSEDLEPLTRGVPVELVFDLMPTSVLFHEGSRMRVTITCADKDTFRTPAQDPPPRVSLFHTVQHPSRVTLPMIPR